ncbi:MAG TPA: type II toxin-antitoxin system RelE/ParE family toxin [Actinobacteria bacterium]|nr:type II toxin-antitoxin system RelE/ParE family toxin [Actinomycetota bacterium]
MTSRYEIRIARRAAKSLAGLERREQQRIRAAIELLADNPRPPACVAMSGEPDVYRVRVGDYRIVYEVIDAMLVIHVVRVGHRREVYR